MLNIVLTEDGAVEAPGRSDYFLSDSDFIRVQNDNEFAKELYNYFKERVCLGRLGTKDIETDAYVEKNFDDLDLEPETANLCFYEKVEK